MDYPIRPMSPGELLPFFSANSSAFGWDFRPERFAYELWPDIREYDRSTSVWDGDQVVGTAGIWTFETAVPGGLLPTAGVTWVSVRPTHRRKGILTAMMRSQLDAVHERGEPLATLWASESVIYGRFGYGNAATGVEMTINPKRASFTQPGSYRGRTRFVEREAALRDWPAVYDRVRVTQPGMHSRHANWWEARNFNISDNRAPAGFTRHSLVQYEEDGNILGYVMYRTKEHDTLGVPDGTIRVTELMAETDAAYCALWEFVLGIDLIETVEAPFRRVDEPLAWMLADPRQLHRQLLDSLWVRLVDVPAALAGRRYLSDGSLVINVVDQFCPWNAGSYLLEGGPGGATCSLTTRTPDITLNANGLGAVFLGGVRFETLAHANRVEGSAEAIRLADRMFQWDRLPWEPEVF